MQVIVPEYWTSPLKARLECPGFSRLEKGSDKQAVMSKPFKTKVKQISRRAIRANIYKQNLFARSPPTSTWNIAIMAVGGCLL